MIPRALLFGNPAIGAASISPDGRWLAWAASAEGVMNLWLAPRECVADARQITFDARRGIAQHQWSWDSAHVLYSQDTDGDENHRLYAVDVAGGGTRCLTPWPGTRSGIVRNSRKRPGSLLISLNRRDPRHADLYTLALAGGDPELVLENPGYASFIADDDYTVRFAVAPTPDGGRQLLARDAQGAWQVHSVVEAADARNTGWSHLSADGGTLYGFDSRGRDTAALTATDLHSGRITVLCDSPLADVGSMLTDAQSYRPLGCWINHQRPELQVLDEGLRTDAQFMQDQCLGSWGLASRTADDRLWLVGAASDTRPGVTYLYDRNRRSLEALFVHRPDLAGCRLSRMQTHVVSARDGLPLVCYLTLPQELDAGTALQALQPAPLVLMVHGGPWSRDGFGFNAMHQWLADRGYAVLSVNFRSSTGFGKAFINAGDGQWGRKMNDDLDDAVDWAIQAGLADPKRMAIVGGSYGGFAVLSALTQRPGRYVCGVDIFGPSNLESLLAAIPPQWEHERQMLYRAVGNPTTAEGRADLRSRSPLFAASAIADPLLVVQGANDPRVKQRESDQMVAELAAHGIAVTYLLFPDEGHGFGREPNRLVFNAAMESFLARHLGGRLEPWTPEDFSGHTMQVLRGAL